MNLKQLNYIGTGPYFPIKLTTVLDENGNPEQVVQPDGTIVNKISWRNLKGDINLIKQNLTSLFTYQLGQRIRQEYFGSRVWECIEEPNTQALSFMIKTFVKNSIVSWEPRITALDVQSERVYDKIHIQIRFAIQNQTSISELNFEYNPSNNTINVN